jgi:hypothetical protein
MRKGIGGSSLARLANLCEHLSPVRVAPGPRDDDAAPPVLASSSASSSASASASSGIPTEAQRAQYDANGYVKIGGLVSGEMVQRLLAATDRVTELARSLGPSDTTSPLRFSPRTAHSDDGASGDGVDFKRHNPAGYLHTLGEPWSINGVLHPDLPEAAVFLEYIGSPAIVAAARSFLGGQELQLGDVAPFVNAPEADFCIGWHRDMNWYSNGGADPDFSDAAERSVWERRSYDTAEIGDGRMTDSDDRRINASNRSPEGRGRVKWHLALLSDDGFEIVPGSHLRWRTEQERAVIGHYNGDLSTATAAGLTMHSELDGGVVVHAEPGDCIFWNGDCIHRGFNRADVERRTLACNYDAWDPRQTVESVAVRGGSLSQQANWVWRCEPRVGEAMPTEFLKEAWRRWRLCQPHAHPGLLSE